MLLDPQTSWLRPLWARIAVTAVPLLCSALAFDQGWVLPGAVLAGVAGWVFRRLFLP